MVQRVDKDSLKLDQPRRTPGHPTKSHIVKTKIDGKEKILRFGEQGAETAGKPKEGESERMKAKRASFKSRHAKNIAKGKSSPAYWANKVKWAEGGPVTGMAVGGGWGQMAAAGPVGGSAKAAADREKEKAKEAYGQAAASMKQAGVTGIGGGAKPADRPGDMRERTFAGDLGNLIELYGVDDDDGGISPEMRAYLSSPPGTVAEPTFPMPAPSVITVSPIGDNVAPVSQPSQPAQPAGFFGQLMALPGAIGRDLKMGYQAGLFRGRDTQRENLMGAGYTPAQINDYFARTDATLARNAAEAAMRGDRDSVMQPMSNYEDLARGFAQEYNIVGRNRAQLMPLLEAFLRGRGILDPSTYSEGIFNTLSIPMQRGGSVDLHEMYRKYANGGAVPPMQGPKGFASPERLAAMRQYDEEMRVTPEDLDAAGYTPSEIDAYYEFREPRPSLSQADIAQMAEKYGTLQPADPTLRQRAGDVLSGAMQDYLGMDNYYANKYARRIVGDPSAPDFLSSLGLADLTGLAAPFAMQEGARTFERGLETDDYLTAGMGALEAGLGAVEAIPYVGLAAKGAGPAARFAVDNLMNLERMLTAYDPNVLGSNLGNIGRTPRAPQGAKVKPKMGEAFDDWVDRIYAPENRGSQNVVQDENVVFRAMSPEEARAGEAAGVFKDITGQPMYVANDPERYVGGGAYGGKRQGRIYEFDVTDLTSKVRQGGFGIQEKAISEIPADRVRRIWEWNPDAQAHELILDNTQQSRSSGPESSSYAAPRPAATVGGPTSSYSGDLQEAPLAEMPRITPSDLVGARIIPTVADLTRAGGYYRGIDASQIDVPEPMMGGPGYPLLPSSQQAGLAWAVQGKSMGTKKGLKGADLIAVTAMNPTSHKSNISFINSLIKTTGAYVRDDRIPPQVLGELDARVRAASTGPGLSNLETFPGFESPNLQEWISNASFEDRSRIADIIATKEMQSLGLPNVNRVLQETVDPRYAGANPRDTLFFIEPDFSLPVVDLRAEGLPIHPSYRYGLRGRVFGALDQNISTFEMFPEFWGEKNVSAFGPNFDKGGRRAFDLSIPITDFTNQKAEEIERIIRSSASNYGPTRAAARLSPIDTRIVVNSMLDRWKPSTKPVNAGGVSPQAFADAINNSKYRPALTNYTAADVKAGAKSGDFTVYQLGDDEVFFGIDAKPDYSWAGVEMMPGDKALVGVVSNAPGAKGTAAPSVMAKAIEEGVTVLDAFAVPSQKFPDGFLPEYYGKFGFQEVGRVPFDPELYIADHGEQAYKDLRAAWKSDGWDESMGMPPVIVMRWSGNDADRTATAAGIRGAGSPSTRAEPEGLIPEARGSAGRGGERPVSSEPPGVGRGASGSTGAGDAVRLAARAGEPAAGILGLSPRELQNRGISRDQIRDLARKYELDLPPDFSRGGTVRAQPKGYAAGGLVTPFDPAMIDQIVNRVKGAARV